MTATILPLYSDPYYTYTIDLDNEMFRFKFRWNGRAQQWMITIIDSDDEVIIRNIPMVPAYPLLSQFSLEKPVGELFLLPLNTLDELKPIPDPREVRKTHFLVYEDFIE